MGKHDISSTLRKRAENTSSVTMPPSSQDDATDLAYEALCGGAVIPQQSKRTSKMPIEQLHLFKTANIGFKPYNDCYCNSYQPTATARTTPQQTRMGIPRTIGSAKTSRAKD